MRKKYPRRKKSRRRIIQLQQPKGIKIQIKTDPNRERFFNPQGDLFKNNGRNIDGQISKRKIVQYHQSAGIKFQR